MTQIKVIDFFPDRPKGLLDSDLAEFLSTTAARINHSAKRNYIPESENELRYKLSPQEFLLLKDKLRITNTRGGRRYLPFVYTFKGICYIIGRLRLNLSEERKNELLRLFGENELQIFDYGYNRPEENLERLLSTVLKDIDVIERHYPVVIDKKQYFVDFFLNTHKIVIEMDEYHHHNRTAIDKKRQRTIEEYHGFKFFRIKDTDDYLAKLNEILLYILGKG
jgi:very-short-patch-repair endonuclease